MPNVSDLVRAAPTEHGVIVAGPGAGKTRSVCGSTSSAKRAYVARRSSFSRSRMQPRAARRPIFRCNHAARGPPEPLPGQRQLLGPRGSWRWPRTSEFRRRPSRYDPARRKLREPRNLNGRSSERSPQVKPSQQERGHDGVEENHDDGEPDEEQVVPPGGLWPSVLSIAAAPHARYLNQT